MKKYLIAALAALFLAGAAQAQDLLRYNYKKNGYVYTGTERIRVTGTGGMPMQLKLGRVSFPDGAAIFILHIDFESTSAWKIPKNAPLTVTTTSGKTVISKNASDAPNLIAPQGIRGNGGTKTYWNYGEYYFEEDDIQKIAVGVSRVEAQRRWSTDGIIKVDYKNDEFGSAVYKQFEAICNAPVPKAELGSQLKSLSDQGGNRMADTKTLSVNGQLSLSLGYVYYASENAESYELDLYLPGKEVPLDGAVSIVTSAGETIRLKQEKVSKDGRVTLYPEAAQLKRMARGVSRVSLQSTSGAVNLNFPDKSFSEAVEKLYNALQTASIL